MVGARLILLPFALARPEAVTRCHRLRSLRWVFLVLAGAMVPTLVLSVTATAQLNQTPKKRTAFVYAPHPSGKGHAENIERFLCAENYTVTRYVKDGNPAPTLANLRAIAASGFGVLVLICHGSSGGLTVEDFSKQDDARAAVDAYKKDPEYADLEPWIEGVKFDEPRLANVHYGVGITNEGLKKLFGAADANHSVVVVLACNSWNLQTEHAPFGATDFLGFESPAAGMMDVVDLTKTLIGFESLGGARGIPDRTVKRAFEGFLRHLGPPNTTLAPASPSHLPADESYLALNVETPGSTSYETEMSGANAEIMSIERNGCEAVLSGQVWASLSEHRFKVKPTKKGRLMLKTEPTSAVSRNNDNWLIGNRYRLAKTIDENDLPTRPEVPECPCGDLGLDGRASCAPPANPLRWCVWCGEKPSDPGQPSKPSRKPQRLGEPGSRQIPPGDRESFVLFQDAPESLTVIQAIDLPPNMTFQQVGDWYGHVVFTPAQDQVGQQYTVRFRSSDIHGVRDSSTLDWQVVPRMNALGVFVPDTAVAAGDLGLEVVQPGDSGQYALFVANSGNTVLTNVTLSTTGFGGPGSIPASAVTITPDHFDVLVPDDVVAVTVNVATSASQTSGSYVATLRADGQAGDGPAGAASVMGLRVNRLPRIHAAPDTIRVAAGGPVAVPLTITDPDSDSLRAGLELAPAAASLEQDGHQLTFYWTPQVEDTGSFVASFVADDGWKPRVHELVLQVTPPIAAPTLRADAIWARATEPDAITLDGVLGEPAWATAESTVIRWATDSGIPGSGWKAEAGTLPADPLDATLKFLRDGNQLYMAAIVRDRSVGGSEQFSRFDGLMMGIQDHRGSSRPTSPLEYFYSWYWPGSPDPRERDREPSFIGAWGDNPPVTARTPAQVANWDARTVVDGHANSDTLPDVGYVTEMRFDVAADGYDYTRASGDAVEFNISLYDCDNFWPLSPTNFSSNRTWWQGPWATASFYGEARIHGREDVRYDSGPVPVLEPDVRIPEASAYPSPVADGQLTEAAWRFAPRLDIRFGDAALRATYPGAGPYRSGQVQPFVNGQQAIVVDPGDATIHWFFQGDRLHLGLDVRDQFVQYHPLFDRQDGFVITLNDRGVRGPDQNLLGRRLSFFVGPSGTVQTADYLATLVGQGGAGVSLHIPPGTTVDTVGADLDRGYTAELWVDLTRLGYPPGLGDGVLFLGITLLDGDSFAEYGSTPSFSGLDVPNGSYGTRTWWFRDSEVSAAPAWAYLDRGAQVLDAHEDRGALSGLSLLGIHPNPSRNRVTIRYSLDESSEVFLELYDLQGRRIETVSLGRQSPGPRQAVIELGRLRSGLYFHRLRVHSPTGTSRATPAGKIMILR